MIKFVESDERERCGRCYYFKKICSTKRCTGDHRGYYVQVPNKAKKAKKAAEVDIAHSTGAYWFRTRIECCDVEQRGYVSSRASAVRKAREFCTAIGYKCVIKG